MPFSGVSPMLPHLSWRRKPKAGHWNVVILPVLQAEVRLHLYVYLLFPFLESQCS